MRHTDCVATGMLVHIVSRTEHPQKPFLQRIHCVRTWWRLMEQFPHALACVLMPNHVHMILETNNVESDFIRFRQSLGYLPFSWQAPVKPALIPDHKHLWRNIRYVHLNPCRSRLCADPLEWEWSTYRDYMGVVWPVWPDLTRVRHQLEWQNNTALEWEASIHKMTSSDQTVSQNGTSLPLFTNISARHQHSSVQAINTAAARAFRRMPEHFLRRCKERAIIAQCAESLPGIDIYAFAEHFGVTIRGLHKMRVRKVPQKAIIALQRTLCDHRLIGPPLIARTSAPKFRLEELQGQKPPPLLS